jgi:hypothetical protein
MKMSLAVLIFSFAPFFAAHAQTPAPHPAPVEENATAEEQSKDVHILSVCCPVDGAPACGWGNFPIGSECYCSDNGKVHPGTVCGK